MSKVVYITVVITALAHVCFLVLEMFFWDKPFGLWAFDLKQEFATASKSLAANQGLYNGFLAVGLFWGLSLETQGRGIIVFFLCCVLIAGLYGAASTRKIKILLGQAVPAALALALVFWS